MKTPSLEDILLFVLSRKFEIGFPAFTIHFPSLAIPLLPSQRVYRI